MAARQSICLIVFVCVFMGLFLVYHMGRETLLNMVPKEPQDVKIASLFANQEEEYNIQKGTVYDCFTGDVRETFGGLNNVVSFSPKNNGTISNNNTRRQNFQNIFDNRSWMVEKINVTDKMSPEYRASGSGSSLKEGQPPLALLHSVIERLKKYLNKPVISMMDIPCGDFYWIRELVGLRSDVSYTGIDIVPTLIQRHRRNNAHMKNAKFYNIDIVTQKLNESYDIIFCRDMLQHLPLHDVMQVLDHFSSSGSKLLVTTQLKGTGNHDIGAGGYQHLNLMLPPINLTPPICEIKEYGPREKHLAIWKLPLKQN